MTFQLFSAWPTEALNFATAVERAGHLVRAARRGIAAVDELSLANWRLLALMHVMTVRGQSGLARRLRVSRQAVHGMARRLQSSGFLARARGPVNRKSTRLVLTPKGALLLASLDETLESVLLEVTNDIPRETLVAATHLLDRFSVRLRRSETIMRRQRPGRPGIRRA